MKIKRSNFIKKQDSLAIEVMEELFDEAVKEDYKNKKLK